MKIGADGHNLEQICGGAAVRYLTSLLRCWRNCDDNFVIYFKERIPQFEELDAKNFRLRLPKAWFDIQSRTLFQHFLLPWAARKDRVEVLFCPYYVSPIFGCKKIVLTLQDVSYEANSETSRRLSLRQWIFLKINSRLSARKASAILVPSEFTRREVAKYYRISPRRIFLIPLGIDGKFKVMLNSKKIEEIKKKYEIKDNFVLFVGIILNRRHVTELIEAFRLVSARMKGYQLLIIGNNETQPFIDIDGMVEAINRQGRWVIKRIESLPEQDLVPIYNAASLTVYLSDYEGFGLPILESMACGTPVITTRSGALPEVAGGAAIYVNDSTNVTEISEALFRGVTDIKLRKALIEKGLERIKRFSWRKCAEETMAVMRQVIKNDCKNTQV